MAFYPFLWYCVALTFVCRQIFCDFGDAFTVSDTDGEQPASVMIAAVTKVMSTMLLLLMMMMKYVWKFHLEGNRNSVY